tara:strand:- start:49 stop:849 length:801 start_codon:yes stop_codon:yes gene_type:complete
MKNKKKYTIFGHTGFLGKNIVRYLKNNNQNCFLPKKKQFLFSKNLNNIIYCIGEDNVFNNPINSIEANLKILTQIITKNKFESFLYISTTRLYLNSDKTSEDDIIKINPFSKEYFFNCLKLASENFCLSQNNKKIKIVRLSNLYGHFFKSQKYLLPTLLRDSVNKKIINLNINKNSKKNYLNVDDAIKIIIKIATKGKNRLYNVASDKQYSLNIIAKKIQKITNCKIKYKNQNIKYNEPIINIKKIKKEFNFKPNNNFLEFLETCF